MSAAAQAHRPTNHETADLSLVDPAKPGLNLISCVGDVIPGTSEFNERIVVFATLL